MIDSLQPLQRQSANKGIGGDPVFLRAALACDRILTEGDGVSSIIRIVDVVTAHVESLAALGTQSVPIPLKMYISFISLGFVGEKVLSLVAKDSEQNDIFTKADTIEFLRPDRSGMIATTTVIFDGVIGFKKSTLVTVDVFVDGEHVTRLPIQIVVAEESHDQS